MSFGRLVFVICVVAALFATPPPKGVSHVDLDPAARMRRAVVVTIGAIAFLIALVTRRVAAAVAAAFLGPAIAIADAARRFANILSGYASAPFDFAGFVVTVWNENQPLLWSLYGGVIALVMLLIVAMVGKRSEPAGSAILFPTFLTIAGAATGVAAFISLTRLVAAIVDPMPKDPIVLSYAFSGLGAAARAAQIRLVIALSVSLATIAMIAATFVLSFMLRPMRARVAAVTFALMVMIACAAIEHAWCVALKTTALTGRFPETFLTR